MFIHDIAFDQGLLRLNQTAGLEWLKQNYLRLHPGHEEEIEKAFGRYACSPEHIQARQTVLYDLDDPLRSKGPILFADDQHPDLSLRMQVYSQRIREVRDRLYPKPEEIKADQLLHVSCTGYEYPNAVQEWNLQKKNQLSLFNVYHMGCYAAIPAIRLAQGLNATSDNGHCEVFHSEFCTLHLDLRKITPEQIIVQSLFADGGIRYQVSKQKPDLACLEILATHEERIPDSLDDMTWKLDHSGFKMGLTKEVPSKIGWRLPGFIQQLFRKAKIEISDTLPAETIWAIHPGGPRIVDAVKDAFGLEEPQVSFSRQVLLDFGNMSSVTLPKIWQSLLEQDGLYGRPILSLAFGPGLTIAGALLCKHPSTCS